MKKKLLLNTFLPILLEIVSIVSGFIVPRFILLYFGSDINGLVASITQFLSVISFFEAGIGSVVRFNLYKPLADKDFAQVSRIVASADRFFQTLGLALLGYGVVLMILYPIIISCGFDYLYTALLIFAMLLSTFGQYYFGQVNMLLVMADQRGYVQYSLQIFAISLNTVACVVLIQQGFGIHAVKLATSLIYLLKPIILYIYVKKRYQIDRKIRLDEEPIKYKWNGLAQHISAVVLDGTDVIVLSLFSTLSAVSIYSVYYLIVSGIKKLITNSTGGIEAVLGNLIALEDKKQLEKVFENTEWIIHSVSTIIFACTAALSLPFVMIYTKGISDADYYVPAFSILISLAYYFHSLRLPYNLLILTAGHYKQTQHIYIISAIINILVSIVLVWAFGLIGVAIGTIVAMLYQTFWMAKYTYKSILDRDMKRFAIQFVIDVVLFAIMILSALKIHVETNTYFDWVILGIKTFIVCLVESALINVLFFKEKALSVYIYIKNRLMNIRTKHL